MYRREEAERGVRAENVPLASTLVLKNLGRGRTNNSRRWDCRVRRAADRYNRNDSENGEAAHSETSGYRAKVSLDSALKAVDPPNPSTDFLCALAVERAIDDAGCFIWLNLGQGERISAKVKLGVAF
jgi:hypothetical protein